MKLYRRKDSNYWWVDLRRYGLGLRSTKIPLDKKPLAESYVIQYLAKNKLSPIKKKGTLQELVDRYLIHSESVKTGKVYIRDRDSIKLFLVDVPGNTSVYAVSREQIEQWMRNRVGKVSKASVNREYGTIRNMSVILPVMKSLLGCGSWTSLSPKPTTGKTKPSRRSGTRACTRTLPAPCITWRQR